MCARLAGAWPIIAVDMVDLKLEKAKEIGADYVINASNENPTDKIKELTGGGADFAFDCSGHVSAMIQAFASIHQAGTGVLVAQANMADILTVVPGDFILGKILMGVAMGNIKAHLDIPIFVDLFMEGRLPIDKLISKAYKLEQLNEAFEAMKKGEIHRSVIIHE
jgi:Zn-dependent alcohol dehydrogenase